MKLTVIFYGNFISMERDTICKLRIDLHVIERNKYLVTEPEFCPPQTGCGTQITINQGKKRTCPQNQCLPHE